MSRNKKFAINSFFGILSYVSIIITNFFLRKYFINFLGYETLGLQSVLATIINTLSLAELGIGMAIIFSLYKPLAENDEKKVAILIRLYKKIYSIIALVILAIGLAILPGLPYIVTEYSFKEIVGPYLLVLLGAVLTYLYSYNHCLLAADQKNFIISITNSIVNLVMVGLQLVILFVFKNFMLFILVSVIIRLLGNIVLSIIVKKRYPFIKNKQKEKLSPEESKTIKTKVVALVYHKLGGFFNGGIDNIIISIFIGITMVGYYANYLLLSQQFTALIAAAFTGIAAFFGNMLVTEKTKHTKQTFYNMRFMFFLIYTIVFCGLFVLSGQFLTLWLGSKTVLPVSVALVWSLNTFLYGYAYPAGELRAAAGLFEPDKYLHIFLPIINVVLSIILVKICGLVGILLATTAVAILKEIIVLPRIMYKHIFKESYFEYYKKMLYDYMLVAISVVSCYFINQLIATGNNILNFILGGILCVGMPAIIILIAYCRSREIKHLFSILKKKKKS